MAHKHKRRKKIWRCKVHGRKYKKYSDFLDHRRRRHAEAVAKGKEAANRANYGQSAEEYDAQLEKQHNVCAICRRPAVNVNLSQDHTHRISNLKIRMERFRIWPDVVLHIATNEEFGYSYASFDRREAKRVVHTKLKRKSRRGILCFRCNTGLKKFEDRWRDMRTAADYLAYWEKQQGWDFTKKERLREIWKPFRHGYYEVSNLGRVRRVESGHGTQVGKILLGGPDKDGYIHIISSYHSRQKTHKIHQLVATAFLGPCPDGMEVHHKDEDKANNCWDNLEYITQVDHAREHCSQLTESQVAEIRRLYATGKYHGHSKTLARKFGVKPVSIYFIVNDRRWKEIA